jgi:hypothetical protein
MLASTVQFSRYGRFRRLSPLPGEAHRPYEGDPFKAAVPSGPNSVLGLHVPLTAVPPATTVLAHSRCGCTRPERVDTQTE